jgi:hypothetical protein
MTMMEFEVARREGPISEQATHGFCACSELRIVGGQCVKGYRYPCTAQALWRERDRSGVSTCDDHVGGTHGRANPQVHELKHQARALSKRIALIHTKADKCKANHTRRSPKAAIARLLQEALSANLLPGPSSIAMQ